MRGGLATACHAERAITQSARLRGRLRRVGDPL